MVVTIEKSKVTINGTFYATEPSTSVSSLAPDPSTHHLQNPALRAYKIKPDLAPPHLKVIVSFLSASSSSATRRHLFRFHCSSLPISMQDRALSVIATTLWNDLPITHYSWCSFFGHPFSKHTSLPNPNNLSCSLLSFIVQNDFFFPLHVFSSLFVVLLSIHTALIYFLTSLMPFVETLGITWHFFFLHYHHTYCYFCYTRILLKYTCKWNNLRKYYCR